MAADLLELLGIEYGPPTLGDALLEELQPAVAAFAIAHGQEDKAATLRAAATLRDVLRRWRAAIGERDAALFTARDDLAIVKQDRAEASAALARANIPAGDMETGRSLSLAERIDRHDAAAQEVIGRLVTEKADLKEQLAAEKRRADRAEELRQEERDQMRAEIERLRADRIKLVADCKRIVGKEEDAADAVRRERDAAIDYLGARLADAARERDAAVELTKAAEARATRAEERLALACEFAPFGLEWGSVRISGNPEHGWCVGRRVKVGKSGRWLHEWLTADGRWERRSFSITRFGTLDGAFTALNEASC